MAGLAYVLDLLHYTKGPVQFERWGLSAILDSDLLNEPLSGKTRYRILSVKITQHLI